MVFEELYRAIWRQAIKDETRAVTQKAYNVGIESAYGVYIRKADEPLCLGDERFKAIKRDIWDYIKLRSDDISLRIKKLVYKESQEWPNNSRKLRQDKEYKKLLQKLIDETIEFARERMKNRWMKI